MLNRRSVQVWCMRQGAEGQCTGTTLRKDMGRRMGGVFRIRDTYTSMGRHPWCILWDHRTCHLRNLYADQEAAVTTEHGLTDWFQIGKGVGQGCILSPCLLNLYAEYIMRNAGLEEVQSGIKIAGRNINNSDMQMTPPFDRKWRTKEPHDERERRLKRLA